ncbi:MAG TPA: RIO1 family regulatory kinase/ATPase [Chloroflexota bacterium]|jgi:RIO kinase 1|nr:RIO1 family regulatory kinase/ATPase [Chloroflexota bacterium]
MAHTSLEASIESILDEFFARGLITDVLNVVKSGKEATVFRCRAAEASGVPFFAAKVYRPLTRRSFRNDAVYQDGRPVGDRKRRDRLAFQQKSRRGREVQFGDWVAAEFRTLQTLHAAGVDLPRPVARHGPAILMEYVGDDTTAAPVLSHVTLPPEAARPLFDRLLDNLARCLSRHCVHADLSPFNILYWQGEPKIIDFPQAVDPRFNRNARTLFERDVANLSRYFERYGVAVEPARLADELWARYLLGDL